MKTVVISGYYGYDNTGDEALLASIVQALRKRRPDLRIIVLSAKPEETARQYRVLAENRLSLTAVFKALREADLLISGGGSLLQDVTGPLTIPYYLGVVALARLMGKPVMFYAQGIGPVKGWLGRALIRWVGNRVNLITLRDSASAQLLKNLGVRRPLVEITADPVFGLELEEAGAPAPDRQDKAIIGIFIREWQGISGYKRAVAGLADELAQKGRQVVLIPMQYPEDIAPAVQIAEMAHTAPLVVREKLSLAEMVRRVSSMEMILGMRLHALILAAACGVPMVGLSYDPKVSEFLQAVGQPMLADLAEEDPERLLEAVNGVLDARAEVKQRLQERVRGLREQAWRNADLAAALLEVKRK